MMTESSIDLGIKELAVCSDGTKYKNINKSQKIKKLEKQKRLCSISRSSEKWKFVKQIM